MSWAKPTPHACQGPVAREVGAQPLGEKGWTGLVAGGSQSAMLRAGSRLPPGASGRQGKGRGIAAVRWGTCCARGFGRGLPGACAACELMRRSSSKDALGNHRTAHTSHVPIPGPALGPAALLTPPLPSPACLLLKQGTSGRTTHPLATGRGDSGCEHEVHGAGTWTPLLLPGLQPRALPCPTPPTPSLWRGPGALGRVLFPDQPRGPDHLSMGTARPSATDWEGGPCTLRSCQLQARPPREGRSVNAWTSRVRGDAGTLDVDRGQEGPLGAVSSRPRAFFFLHAFSYL